MITSIKNNNIKMTDKTELQKHVDKALAEILFNGCRISSAWLRNYFETTILLAKIEASEQATKSMFKIVPDPNKPIEIIGQHLTEPHEHNIN